MEPPVLAAGAPDVEPAPVELCASANELAGANAEANAIV
jgi:hypothetical protein